MRKRVFGKKLSRERASRQALFVSMVENLVIHGSIKTTKAKAKAVVGFIDKLVTLAKKDTLASKRQVLKKLRGNKKVATILWTQVATTFSNRHSGFTRIVPLVQRKGDMTQMVKLEWVEKVEQPESEKEKESKEKKIKKTTKTKEKGKTSKTSREKNEKKGKESKSKTKKGKK